MVLLPNDCLRDDLTEESAKRFKTNAVLWLGQTTNRSLIVNFTDVPVNKPFITINDFYVNGTGNYDPIFWDGFPERVRNGGGIIMCQSALIDKAPINVFTFPANK